MEKNKEKSETDLWNEAEIADMNKTCEVCYSKNITDPIEGTQNGICHECGFHW
jgi:hypothetical protein